MHLINPRRACASRVMVVGSVSLSRLKLPYVMFIHPTNDVAHLTGNEGLCGAHGYTCSHVHKPLTMLIGQRNVVSDSASFSLLKNTVIKAKMLAYFCSTEVVGITNKPPRCL